MSEVFITYNITISEEELEIISEMVENEGNQLEMEGAVINGILEQILDQAKSRRSQLQRDRSVALRLRGRQV